MTSEARFSAMILGGLPFLLLDAQFLSRRDKPLLIAGLQPGGQLTITMLRSIGNPVDVHEIDRDVMAQAIRSLLPSGARA